MAQYGFYFDQTVCAGCHTCQIACKDKNRLDVGTLYRQVRTFEVGEYPNPGIYHLATACNHCDEPACVTACPTKRTVKDEETGLVVHDDNIQCLGEMCQMCVKDLSLQPSGLYPGEGGRRKVQWLHRAASQGAGACLRIKLYDEGPEVWPH